MCYVAVEGVVQIWRITLIIILSQPFTSLYDEHRVQKRWALMRRIPIELHYGKQDLVFSI